MTRGYPPNKYGFRYMPCGPAPPEFMTPTGPCYRSVESEPTGVARFSWEDRSPFVFISQCGTVMSTDKGFRSARANVPLREGTTYFEVFIDKGGGQTTHSKLEAAHVRLGIGRRESSLNAPVGMDAYSYGLRDKTGHKVTISQPEPYGEAFGTGDVIGVLVDLPPRPENNDLDPEDPMTIIRKRIPIRYKGQTFYESLEYVPSREMTILIDEATEARLPQKKQMKQKAAAPGMKHRPLPSENGPAMRKLPVLRGSSVYFFKNGKPMSNEPAFKDLYDFLPLKQHPPAPEKTNKKKQKAWDPMRDRENHNDDGTLGYYPVVSCYGGAVARLNSGPDLFYPPDLTLFEHSDDPTVRKLTDFVTLQDRYLEYVYNVAFMDEQELRRTMATLYATATPGDVDSASATPQPSFQGPPIPVRSRSASQAPSSPMPQQSMSAPASATLDVESTTPKDRQVSPLVPVKREEEPAWQQPQPHQTTTEQKKAEVQTKDEASEPVEQVPAVVEKDASGESDTEMQT